MLLEQILIFTVEFVAVPVALADLGLAIRGPREAVFGKLAGISAQAHGAAQLIHALELPQFVDDAVGRGGVELGRIPLREATHGAGVLAHPGPPAHANAEGGNLAFAPVADAPQHTLAPPP